MSMIVHTSTPGGAARSTEVQVPRVTYDTIDQLIASDTKSKCYESGVEGYINTGALEANVFVLDRNSTATPNGTTVFAAVLSGNWLLAYAAGGGGDVGLVSEEIPFTFTSGTVEIEPIPAGSKFVRATVRVDTTFDDVAATLQLGTDTTPALVLAAGDQNLNVAANYNSDAIVDNPAASTVRLTITPGASTQGAGVLFYQRTSV